MKKFTAAAVTAGILLASLLITACEPKVPGMYKNTDKDFSIVFPEDWDYEENFMGTEVISFSPVLDESDKFSENVSVGTEELNPVIPLEEYYELGVSYLPEMVTDYKLIEEGETEIDGLPTKYIIYLQSMGAYQSHILIYMTIKDSTAYLITCAATPETMEEFRPQFEEIKNSFKFLP